MIRRCLRPAVLAIAGLSLAAPAWAAEPAAQPAGAAAASTFDILEYTVEGNTLLPQIDIERAVYPFLGEGKTIKQVEDAREALEKAYRDKGYLTVLVDIPPQKVEGGAVTLKVTEATVERLRVTGSRYYALGDIKDGAPSVAEGSVPNFNELQKELAQLNRSPGRNVAPVMRPAKTPGKVEVDLEVKDESPFHASLEANNRYSLNTTHSRVAAQVRYDNLWQLQHSLSLQFQEAPERPDDTRVFSASYVIPGGGDHTYAFYAVKSESSVASVGSLNVLGNGHIYGARMIQALAQVPGVVQSLTVGVDYKSFRENLELGEGSVETPIRYLPFSIQYSATVPELSGSSTGFEVGTTFAIRGLMTNLEEFANKRASADTSFAVLRAALQRTQVLPGDWKLFGRIDAQAASGALVSNEQFVAGGATSVRGYLESEVLGDDGIRGSLEIRTPRLAPAAATGIKTFYLLAFAEGARLRIRDVLPGQQESFAVSSAGFGLRLEGKGLSIDLDAAHAFRDGGTGDGNTHAGSNRILFRGIYEF